ncbi:hypothetical protein [Parasporobacterium paucivorans]|uniref:Uncharacterized protein n=1 Tax=Parasporobacterium paucivorans DSM 15970 TaxID=1122934 RepID=A0A1M6FQ11_9FIRM|nr:hypothetical protein [Parasporobacterium paucivorans]SHI99756.1 hypothetical protein SAMN02745691_01166 [Parasporobacterium paucivorans DSM 15970]
MEAVKNKVDAIRELENQGVLTTEEAWKCIQILNESGNEAIDFEEELFFID